MAAHRQECIDHDRGHHSWRHERDRLLDQNYEYWAALTALVAAVESERANRGRYPSTESAILSATLVRARHLIKPNAEA